MFRVAQPVSDGSTLSATKKEHGSERMPASKGAEREKVLIVDQIARRQKKNTRVDNPATF